MEAIRTTIDSERLATIIDLPASMRHKEVEVIVLNQSENTDMKSSSDRCAVLRNLKGCLHQYADPVLREQEEGAWEQAAAEKYQEKRNDDRS